MEPILPGLDLRPDVSAAHFHHGLVPTLYLNQRQLFLGENSVVVTKGLVVSKKLTYDDKIVAAVYTTFASDLAEALVVCTPTAANVYYDDGRSYVVSFPFTVKKAFAYQSGLIVEKNNAPGEFYGTKFVTVVDPLGELRPVATSLTSVVSAAEELLCFPEGNIAGDSTESNDSAARSLCATYNHHDNTIVFYHIRAPAPRAKHRSARRLDDEMGPGPNAVSVSSVSALMDKKRTSTLLAGRWAEPRATLELSARKDMILTRVDALQPRAAAHHLAVAVLAYDSLEAVVVCNRKSQETNVYIFDRQPRFVTSFSIQCRHAVPLRSPNHPGWLVLLKDRHLLCLVHPFLNLTTPAMDLRGNFAPAAAIVSCYGGDVAIAAQLPTNEKKSDETIPDGTTETTARRIHTVSLVLDPVLDVVRACLAVFRYLAGGKVHQQIWTAWRCGLMANGSRDEWHAMELAMLALCGDDSNNLPVDYAPDLLPYAVLALHLIYEDTKLDALASAQLARMASFLACVTRQMGWPEAWGEYYAQASQDKTSRSSTTHSSPTPHAAAPLDRPPNLFQSLASLFVGPSIPYLTISQLTEESAAVDAEITPSTYRVLRLFELVARDRPRAVVGLMASLGLTLADLETMPPGVALPLKECLLRCQESPAYEWSQQGLALVGRHDLSVLLAAELASVHAGDDSGAPPAGSTGSAGSAAAVVDVLARNDAVAAWDGQLEADRLGITKLIFDYDRRYYEITTLLHQTRTQTATLHTDDTMSEYDVVVAQRQLAAVVVLRTLTIPLGRAALFYGGRIPLLTERFPIPKFNLSTKIAPSMATIVADTSAATATTEWGYFHNGVSSGLSIAKQAKGISGSWIIFNKPPDLNAQHAGFLLGLGLNGHLNKLEEWHIYNYLGPKHPLTSVGLLIGMAASLKGSMDNKLTKVLSVHAVALLPQGANDLNVPVMVQTAGLIGIGLLYLQSQHRRMSEILLSQLYSAEVHEGYRLAAGISLGLVNLAKGDDLRGLNDTHVVDRLLALAISMKDTPAADLDRASAGAIVALGLIYMGTANGAVAEKLAPPPAQLLDYVRPDLLLLRVVARNLILWDDIGDSVGWVESNIPPSLAKFALANYTALDSDQLPYFNILGGACLSLALKYASSRNITARNTLLYYLDLVMTVMCPTSNYDQTIAFNAASSLQNLLALCLSLVMSGSGDLETFRRLRIIYNDTSLGYGNYLAINMALGFLFLGGGQYAFANSNFSIACLFISLYPVFPIESSEDEVHLQVLRHFWALAVEPRCLVVRDVETRTPSKVPVIIRLKSGRLLEELSPCLLPHLDEILTISTKSPDHFDVHVDFSLNSEYVEILKKSLTIFVYRRQNYSLLKSSVKDLLENENKSLQIENGEIGINTDIAKILKLGFSDTMTEYEKQRFLFESSTANFTSNPRSYMSELSIFKILDTKMELTQMASRPKSVQDLWNLRLLFAFTDRMLDTELHYLSMEYIERLKHQVWQLTCGE